MVLLNGTRLISLLEDLHRSMVLIMRRHLLFSQNDIYSHSYCPCRCWSLYHMDVKIAFLNDDLSEVVYISLILVFLLYLNMYADFDELYMV